MPKDPSRNQPNYKIGGYHLNEYEYQQNSGQITKEEDELPRPKENVEGADLLVENTDDQENQESPADTDGKGDARANA